MKKIFTLVLTLGTLTSVFAAAPSVVTTSKPAIASIASSYSYSERERDEQITRIRREYGYKIKEVRESRRLRSSEKDHQVRNLEQQRDRQIRCVFR
ncbi:hypothetical protein V9K67_20595 [Paraflavisolibacter sp. H34]|uniref:hypothetical protein n=1 Tax=Huijunlia imazamoxiresistens TaxID=3127457 RepID=UPI00301A8512